MRLPAAVRLSSEREEFLTETQNVSARGVFFYLDRTLAEGTRVDVTMTFPPHITLTDAVRVRFIARVVRVESPLPSAPRAFLPLKLLPACRNRQREGSRNTTTTAWLNWPVTRIRMGRRRRS